MYEKRQELETAIVTLKRLLENDDASESDYQRWFEAHPIVFRALNFKTHVSHPVLPLDSDRGLIPDFLVESLTGVWELFELKLPGTKVLKDRDTRQTFYASLEEFIQQCLDYSKYFLERENRAVFESKTGIKIGGQLQAILVAGRSSGLDRYKVSERLGDRGHWVRLFTYDDIYEQLVFFKTNTFAAYEGLPGLTVHMTILVRSLVGKERNQLLMVGAHTKHDCISIYVDRRGDLVFEIADSKARVHSSRVPSGDEFFSHDTLTYCTFELGRGQGYSVTSIEVNGKYCSFNVLDEFEMKLSSEVLSLVIGSDCKGQRTSDFDLYEHVIALNTLNLDEREKIRQSVFDYYFGDKKLERPCTRFSGGRFLRTNGHVNFSMDKKLKPSDFVQPVHGKQPLIYIPGHKIGASMAVLYNQSSE